MRAMSLEEYKRKVADNLTYLFGKEFSLQVMKDYEDDFPTFFEEGWTVEGLTPAIAHYFI